MNRYLYVMSAWAAVTLCSTPAIDALPVRDLGELINALDISSTAANRRDDSVNAINRHLLQELMYAKIMDSGSVNEQSNLFRENDEDARRLSNDGREEERMLPQRKRQFIGRNRRGGDMLSPFLICCRGDIFCLMRSDCLTINPPESGASWTYALVN